MQPDTASLVVIYTSIILALVMFPLTWLARNKWKNLNLTRLFAMIGIISIFVFIASVWDYIPD
jgi:hypothetical protein